MLLRIACVTLSLLAVRQAVACTVMVIDPPQVMVRNARIIVEAVANEDEKTLTVEKVRKGTAPVTVSVEEALHVSCYAGDRPVPGQRYLVVVGDLETRNRAFHIDGKRARQLLQTLDGTSIAVSRADLLAWIRAWHYGTVTDASFGAWVKRTTPIADVPDGGEEDVVLHMLEDLERLFSRAPLEKNPCVAVVRKHVAPILIEGLGARVLSEERAAELDEKIFALEEEHPDCLP